MAVNSGSLGTTISFSDLQSAYGGSHPISLSEYYRGGLQVPSTTTTTAKAAASASGTSSKDTESIDVDVTSQTVGGSLGSLTTHVGPNIPYTVVSSDALIWAFAQNSNDDSTPSVIWTITNNSGGTASSGSTKFGSGALSYVIYRGPAYQSGDGIGFGSVSNQTMVAGSTISVAHTGDQANGVGTRRRSFTTTYNHRIQNDSSVTVNLKSSPWGNDSSFTAGKVHNSNGNSSASWNWSHLAVTTTVDSNTNIPTSGTVSLNTYNVPGSFSG